MYKKVVIIFAFLGLAASAVFAFFTFNQFIYNQKQADSEHVLPYDGSLSGEYVCLPHRDTSGPITMECAFGLKTENGEYYALDFGANADPSIFQAGQATNITGRFTPIELLSTDHWKIYDIEGIISVDDTSHTPEAKNDLITVQNPQPNQVIASPLEIRGEARGTWFFEASFPIVLTDWDGKIIAEGIAQAQDEWMTEEFVAFRATLTFENPSWDADFSKRGALILQKDNPSGLPENDDALEIPVRFE